MYKGHVKLKEGSHIHTLDDDAKDEPPPKAAVGQSWNQKGLQ